MRVPWGWMRKMPSIRFAPSAGAFYEKQGERERLRQRQVEEDRRRKANRKAVGIAIAVAIATLIFLLSREQSSTLVRRSGRMLRAQQKKRAVRQEMRAMSSSRQGLELPPPIAPVTKQVEPTPVPPSPPRKNCSAGISASAVAPRRRYNLKSFRSNFLPRWDPTVLWQACR